MDLELEGRETPSKRPMALALESMEESTSPQRRNKRGERGSPYRNPRMGENSSVGEPLTRIEIRDELNMFIIQLIHLESKFIFSNTDFMNCQFTVSKALVKSSLRMTPSLFLALRLAYISDISRIPSVICLPLINTV